MSVADVRCEVVGGVFVGSEVFETVSEIVVLGDAGVTVDVDGWVEWRRLVLPKHVVRLMDDSLTIFLRGKLIRIPQQSCITLICSLSSRISSGRDMSMVNCPCLEAFEYMSGNRGCLNESFLAHSVPTNVLGI